MRAAFEPIGGAVARNSVAIGIERFRESNLKWYMLGLNGFGALAHLIGVVVTLSIGRLDIRMRTYRTNPLNIGNATHPVLSGEAVRDMPVYPTYVLVAFFALSLAAHVFVSINIALSLVYTKEKVFRWYMDGLYRNIAIHRWIEYFFSASLMIFLMALLLGIRDMTVLILLTGLMGITIVFGWIVEVHSSDYIVDVADPKDRRKFYFGWMLERRWAEASWISRLQFHVLGYLPYALLWTVIIERFDANMRQLDDALPDFVNVAVIGSVVIFTGFGVVQLALQVYSFGPSLYWLGEVMYVVMSFTAKAQLGFVVLTQALVEGGLYDTALSLTADS